MKHRFLIAAAGVAILAALMPGCDRKHKPVPPPGVEKTVPGIVNLPVDTTLYERVYYVAAGSGSDRTGSGSRTAPWESISYALSAVEPGGKNREAALLVSTGNYTGQTLEMRPGIDLYGGFDRQDWTRDIEKYPTVIDGNGARRLVIAADNARLDGFHLTGGQIKGRGAAVLCSGVSPVIVNNIFIGNKTLGPDHWNPKYWHETAHDGGAVYCTDGAAPVIKNNVFYKNRTENGRGGAIGCDNKCRPVIIDNVFYANRTGLDDPMRSSDGGAVSVFNWSRADIRGNVFLGNTAAASNDAGGLFVALWSSAEITGNIFVDNEASDDAGALFVGGQEHRYDAPLDTMPSIKDFFVTISGNIFIGNRNSSTNSGAMRFTMESRGAFSRNIVAHNNGIYFQRSEVSVSDNIILDNFLFIETKAGLSRGDIRNNIIWADFTLDAPAAVYDNNLQAAFADSLNYSETPEFVDDQLQLAVYSACFFPKKGYSEIFTGGRDLIPGRLDNRVVQAGDTWGVVKTNTESAIIVFGAFTGITEITVLPTYSLKR